MVGVYGLLSYTVVQRTPELGIRLALGGQPGDIRLLILRDGLRLVLAGVLLGVPAALALAHALRTLLFGVAADRCRHAGRRRRHARRRRLDRLLRPRAAARHRWIR